MSPIKIDLDVVGHLNGSVSKDVNNLSDLTGSLSALTSRLDSAISARRSVGYRLQNVNHTVQELETKLKTLQFLISQSLERYGQSEKEVVKQASLLTNPPSQTVNDNKHWWDSAFGGLAAGATKLGDFAHQAADEFESGASRLFKNAVGETIDIAAGAWYAKEQAMDFIEDCASEAIQALENSKVGSFVEGAADAVVENFTFGVMESESGTEHRKSYIAGKIVGDLASEIAGLAEGVAGAAITGAGLALDATGIGAIAGVALNAAGVAVVGHASSVLYNGASHTGRDASELVQSFKSSEGAGGSELDIIRKDAPDYYQELMDKYGNEGNYHKRTPDEYEDLARDPDHNFNVDDKTRIERQAGLELEVRGDLTGPIVRDPVSGRGEFIDGNGQVWDVKGFNSNYPPKKGGFRLDKAMADIEDELRKGENVILDTTKLSQDHMEQLKNAISTMEWKGKIRWWP